MAYQKPSKDHPWRNYPSKKKKEDKDAQEDIKPVKTLIVELAESWDTIEISTFAYGREGKHSLNSLPQKRQASWLANFLKRNYLKN